MKSSCFKLGAGLTRSSLVVALALGLSAAAANAAQQNATVPLASEDFGNNNGAQAQSTALLNAAETYYYRIVGTVHGTDDFKDRVPPGTKISELVNQIQTGSGATLIGIRQNSGGTLPFGVLNKTYSGTYQGFIDFSVTLHINIQADGRVVFEVTDVHISSPFGTPNGTIVFEQGAKVLVGVAPVIKMDVVTTTVGEGAGTISLKVDRTVNLGAPVAVRFATAPGTAGKTDFAPKSGTLSFAPGEDSKTIKIGIKNDTVKEDAEKFSVSLSKPVAALLGTPKATVVTITDND